MGKELIVLAAAIVAISLISLTTFAEDIRPTYERGPNFERWCDKGTCNLIIRQNDYFFNDNGAWLSVDEAINLTINTSGIYMNWKDKSFQLQPHVIFSNGSSMSLNRFKSDYLSVSVDSQVAKKTGEIRHGHVITVPDSLNNTVDSMEYKIADRSHVDSVTRHSIVFNISDSKFELTFSDLAEKNFTYSLNSTSVSISNFENKTYWDLDPTIQLIDEDTENLADRYLACDNNAPVACYNTSDIVTDLYIRIYNSTGLDQNYVTYIKFNISAVPAGKNIDDASIYLYKDQDYGSGDVRVHHVYHEDNTSESWNEELLNWTNQPCGTERFWPNDSSKCSLEANSHIFVNDTLQYHGWNVTNIVSADYKEGFLNTSFMFVINSTNFTDLRGSKYGTKEDSGTTTDPYLNITYSNATLNLQSPANGSILGVLPEFVWTSISANNYTIEISTDSGFSYTNYSNTVTGTKDENVSLPSNEINKYYWRITANPNNITTDVWTFNYSQWNITFNITGSQENRPILNDVTIRDCSYSNFNQNGDFTNTYGPYHFPNGTWNCTFNTSNYFTANHIFNANSNKIVDIIMPETGGATFQEHTWLQALYDCIILKDCDLYDLLLEINETVGYTWQHVKPTDTSVVLNEEITSANLSAESNITINYTVYVPIKAGYSLGTFLPIRIGFWFLNETNGTCFSQGTLPDGVELIEPYCNPLMVQTLGPMGSNVSFQVDLRPSLANGTYNITRIIEIDPDNVWIGYGQGGIGSINVNEPNSNSESVVFNFAATQETQEQLQQPETLETQTSLITGNAIVIEYEDAFKTALVIIVILAAIAVYFYSKRKK